MTVKSEFTLRTSAGGLIPVQLSLSVVRGYRGKVLGAVVTDLTEQKRKRENEIRHSESMHRLLLERELRAQEAERRRIARELHDEAGQLLTSLLVALRRIEDSRSVGACRLVGRRMREITVKAIDEVGRLARGLHPIALDDHGLEVVLTRYVTDYSKIHKISVHLEVNGLDSERLPSPVQIALYRMLQESLTNVARHAGAKNVQVAFKHSVRALEMKVVDDGRGFDTTDGAQNPNHLGLQSIRERAALLGGSATFTSGSAGTTVLVNLPLINWQLPPLSRGGRA